MLIQSGSVMQILLGRDTGWNPQRRDDGSIPLGDIVRRHRSHVALGVLTLVAGLLISPSLVAWMSPTIAGLILAIPLSWASGQRSIGLFLKRLGLLRTPEETTPPPIAVRANVLAGELARAGYDLTDGISALHASRELRVLHEAYLPAAEPRERGGIAHHAGMAGAPLAAAAPTPSPSPSLPAERPRPHRPRRPPAQRRHAGRGRRGVRASHALQRSATKQECEGEALAFRREPA